MEQGITGRPLTVQFWHKDVVGEELRAAAWGFAEALEASSAEQDRRSNFLTWMSQYLGRPITSVYDFEARQSALPPRPSAGRVTRNLTRTLIDTALSRFAKTETRVSFATEGGTYEQQQRSEENTDAANALFEQTESEPLFRRAALHAGLLDMGALKVVELVDGPRVEHIPAWELMFEPADAHRGRPSILVQRFPADREALIADFITPMAEEAGDDQEKLDALGEIVQQIRESGTAGMVTDDHTETEQHCLVYELWRLPVGRKPGRHVVVTDHALVLDEEWTDKEFPFVFFGWSQAPKGAYPESIAAIVSYLQDELTGICTRKSQVMRLNAVPRFKRRLTAGEGGDVNTAQLRGGTDAIGDVIDIPPGTDLEELPFVDQAMLSTLTNEENQCWSRGFQMTGISEQSATGTRPQGLNSAPAQREWNEINQDRLSLVALDYQHAHVKLAEKLLAAIAKIPDYEISIKDPNGRWLKRMKASALGLDRADYVIVPFPVGALPTTPTGKLAAAADLLQMQAIDREQFEQITQIPDLKSELNINLESRRATQQIVGAMLQTGQYIAPLDQMDLAYAAKYATARLLKLIADAKGRPPQNEVDLLTAWLDDVRKRVEKQAPPAPGPDLKGTSIAPITPAPLAPAPAPAGAEMMAA